MAAYLGDRDRRATLWPRSWWPCSADMLRDDLMDAGINPIDDDDAESRFRVPDGTFRAHYFMLRLHNVSQLNPTSGERSGCESPRESHRLPSRTLRDFV